MFAIYINRHDPMRCGFYTGNGQVSPWRANAATFHTQAEAEMYIAQCGFTPSTSVIPGKVTAYVCAYY